MINNLSFLISNNLLDVIIIERLKITASWALEIFPNINLWLGVCVKD